MRKILYVSGTRADYGLMRHALLCIKGHPKLKLEIAVTGMHLMPEFGRTITEIEKDRFKIHEIKSTYRSDSKESMANFIGEFILQLVKRINKIKPDFILILGDRAEMLAAAIVGAYLMIPVIHIHGGDVSSTVDEVVRHSITKLSHIHLCATQQSAERVIKMGEDAWRVHVVGAPGLDNILNEKLFSKREIAQRYNLDASKHIILLIQHPVNTENLEAAAQMMTTMEAIRELGMQIIVIYPNADAGARSMIRVIEQYRSYPFVRIYKSIRRRDFLSIMKISSAMVGNSSSGIIEAQSLHLPVVNIGMRQNGRERSENIIDTGYDKAKIKRAIRKAVFDKRFREKARHCRNHYGDGKAGERIARLLETIKITGKLLQKKINY